MVRREYGNKGKQAMKNTELSRRTFLKSFFFEELNYEVLVSGKVI